MKYESDELRENKYRTCFDALNRRVATLLATIWPEGGVYGYLICHVAVGVQYLPESKDTINIAVVKPENRIKSSVSGVAHVT